MKMKTLFGWSFAGFAAFCVMAAALLVAFHPASNSVHPVYPSASVSKELPTVFSSTNSELNIIAAKSHN